MTESRDGTCPECGELLVYANLNNGTVDIYCEDCHWPDDLLPAPPDCVICREPSVGQCGQQMRCEDHWIHGVPADE